MKCCNRKYQYSVNGSSIIEVIVSIFLLTFGILALMAAQIRSVSAIRDAENRTLISQAAETLAEGMRVDPTMSGNINSGVTVKYTKYKQDKKSVSGDVKAYQALDSNNNSSLKDIQIANFENALKQIPDISDITYTISDDAEGATITVTWKMKAMNNNNNNDIEYTYQLKVSG